MKGEAFMDYLDIDNILKGEGLRRASDINSLKQDGKRISSKDYPWIKDIVQILREKAEIAKGRISIQSGQYFLVDNMSCINWDKISKYSCFFPERTIISAGATFSAADDNTVFLDAIMLFNFFWGKPVLCNGIADLCPTTEYSFQSSEVVYKFSDMLEECQKSKIALLNKCGTSQINDKLLNHLFIAMPWIYQARLEDYFEIIQKYKTEFANYNSYIASIAKVATNEFELTQQLVSEMRESIIDIQISLEKKQHELKSKGIVTAIGLCLTAIPHVIPSLSNYIDPSLLTAVLGGGSLMECLKLISDYHSDKNSKNDNPFWVLWKWNSKT